MKFILKIVDRWASRRQKSEIQSLISVLAELSKDEMAELVVVTNHVKVGMQKEGNDVMSPFDLVITRPEFPLLMTRRVIDYRKEGNQLASAAFLIWAHTMRAAARPELLPLARQVWRELSRGFDCIDLAATHLSIKLRTEFDIAGATDYPSGFDPRF